MVLFSAKADASGKKAKAGTFSPKTESKGLISISTSLYYIHLLAGCTLLMQ